MDGRRRYYYAASEARHTDLQHLRKNIPSMVFSLYYSGLAAECMLRACIADGTSFDSRHNLENLYSESLLSTLLNAKENVTETRIKGYRVKVSYDSQSAEDMKQKKESVARVIADSIRRNKKNQQ